MADGSASGYARVRVGEIEELDDGREPRRPVRHHVGITAFGVTSWTARAAGDRIGNEHDEEDEGSEERYVLHGRATFELDGERRDPPAGTLVFARAGVRRAAFAEEARTTILAVGGIPGQAYQATGWELWAPVRPLYDAGDHAAAADRERELVEAHPQYAALRYDLACCESLAGRKDEAIDHLRQAIARSERFRSFASGDSDFDPLPDEPEFTDLIGG